MSPGYVLWWCIKLMDSDQCILMGVWWLMSWLMYYKGCLYGNWCRYGCLWWTLHDWYRAELRYHELMIMYAWRLLYDWFSLMNNGFLNDFGEEWCFVMRWKVICCYDPFLFLVKWKFFHITYLCLLQYFRWSVKIVSLVTSTRKVSGGSIEGALVIS